MSKNIETSQALKFVLVINGFFRYCRTGITDGVKVTLLCPVPKRLPAEALLPSGADLDDDETKDDRKRPKLRHLQNHDLGAYRGHLDL